MIYLRRYNSGLYKFNLIAIHKRVNHKNGRFSTRDTLNALSELTKTTPVHVDPFSHASVL